MNVVSDTNLHVIPFGISLAESSLYLCHMQAIFEWWQYRLCDVFIELVKPVMTNQQGGDDSSADSSAEQQAFRETLWLCLDSGLR